MSYAVLREEQGRDDADDEDNREDCLTRPVANLSRSFARRSTQRASICRPARRTALSCRSPSKRRPWLREAFATPKAA